MIDEGSFREDLYYRLNVIEINMPSLAARRDDIPLLLNHFIKLLDKRNKVLSISAPLTMKLQGIDWKGNVRELKNAVERLIIACNDGELNEDVFDRCFNPADKGISIDNITLVAAQDIISMREGTVKEAFSNFSGMLEKAVIEGLLLKNKGNQNLTSEALGVSRQALYEKIKKYGIEVEVFRK